MLKKNNLFIGFVLGVIAPFIAFLFTEYTSLGLRFSDKPLALYAIAAVVNLLLIRYYYKLQASRTGGGLLFITFIGVLLLLFLKQGITV